MRPTETTYRLLQPSDIEACKKIWAHNEKLFGKPNKLGWPTIVAERGGKILGFLSTNPGKALIAGPMIVNGGSSPFVVMRLVEAYEHILMVAGVKTYLFHIDDKNESWLKLVHKANLGDRVKEYRKDDTGRWFQRSF